METPPPTMYRRATAKANIEQKLLRLEETFYKNNNDEGVVVEVSEVEEELPVPRAPTPIDHGVTPSSAASSSGQEDRFCKFCGEGPFRSTNSMKKHVSKCKVTTHSTNYSDCFPD